jgi:carbamoyltransferase
MGKNCNLIFTGGSALNIKWNTALRESGWFKEVWVPPFPNDSGSAFGMAATHWLLNNEFAPVVWTAFDGPVIEEGDIKSRRKRWIASRAEPRDVSIILASNTEDAVVVLNGCAEVGPRALGNRSILMSAVRKENKALLNEWKKREDFRPVAPICLEEHAREYFSPGTPDPYMLFDHRVIESKKTEVPAIVHVDGTARLQTVAFDSITITREILEEYYTLTGIPLLCNTSANLNGHGFFPDIATAMDWCEHNEINFIYSRGTLYAKKEG